MTFLLLLTLYIIYYHLNIENNVKLDEPLVPFSEKAYGSIEVMRVISVHDGDTFTINVKEWPSIVGANMPVRINGIDTPEINSDNVKIRFIAKKAKESLRTILSGTGPLILENIKRDKYFRLDATVKKGGIDVGDVLIGLKLAKPYDGGVKPTWSTKDYDDYKNVLKK